MRVFEDHGFTEIADCYIPRNRATGQSRGFAFVRFREKHFCDDAIERLNGYHHDGRDWTVRRMGCSKGRFCGQLLPSRFAAQNREARRLRKLLRAPGTRSDADLQERLTLTHALPFLSLACLDRCNTRRRGV